MSVKSIWVIILVSFLISLSFCLADLFISESWVFKSPTISVWDLMCDLSFSNVSLMNMSARVFGTWMFRIETSFWLIFPVMNMKCPFPSLLINFVLKSILLDIRIAIAACFVGPFNWNIFSQPLLWGNICLEVEVCFLYAAEGWILFLYTFC